jgi:hypothetical protein
MTPPAEVAAVRERTRKQGSLLALIDPEALIPADRPLRILVQLRAKLLV